MNINTWLLSLGGPALVFNFNSRKSNQTLTALDLSCKTIFKIKQAGINFT